MKRILSIIVILIAAPIFSKEVASLYEYTKTWKDQNNETVQLSKFKDSYVIIGMVYTGCPHACPLTISKVQSIETYFKKAKILNYKLVLASFDVKNDTPQHLNSYMKKRKLDFNQWTFLSTDRDSTARELSVLLGISYKDSGDGDFSHSNVITLLDKNGLILHKIDNLNANLNDFADKVLENEKSK